MKKFQVKLSGYRNETHIIAENKLNTFLKTVKDIKESDLLFYYFYEDAYEKLGGETLCDKEGMLTRYNLVETMPDEVVERILSFQGGNKNAWYKAVRYNYNQKRIMNRSYIALLKINLEKLNNSHTFVL